MDLKITEKKEQPLLSRVKLTGEIFFEATTPSCEDVKKKLSSSIGCDEKLIVIKRIYPKFGSKKADISAYSYYSEEAMKKIEPKQKEKKGKAGQPEPEEKKEQPKEDKKEVKPEEKKEEKKETKEKPEEKK